MCYLIAGLGQTGCSIARYLKRKQQNFLVFDTRKAPTMLASFKAEFPEITIYLEYLPTEMLSIIEKVIVSPGVSLDNDTMQLLAKRKIPMIGDIECFASEVSVPIVAITGTNGKSTVTSVVASMLQSTGLKVAMGGNIGIPVLDLLQDSYDIYVLELSSFQLELVYSLSPNVATILNITADHLDRHHSLDAYVAAKQRIYNNASVCVYPIDDKATYPTFSTGKHITFGLIESTSNVSDLSFAIGYHAGLLHFMHGERPLLPVDRLHLKGQHNWLNALASCAIVHALGLLTDAAINALAQFTGLPHRTQFVKTIAGVSFVNDSKGTNVGATLSALHGLGPTIKGKIVLIAGGQGKGGDFTSLRAPVAQYVRAVVLIGEDALLVEKVLQHTVPCIIAASLQDAVYVAQRQASPGDMVLLSPACASLDMFRDFNHRGEVFISIVESL